MLNAPRLSDMLCQFYNVDIGQFASLFYRVEGGKAIWERIIEGTSNIKVVETVSAEYFFQKKYSMIVQRRSYVKKSITHIRRDLSIIGGNERVGETEISKILGKEFKKCEANDGGFDVSTSKTKRKDQG